LTAINPAGTFAAGFGGSTSVPSPSGSQAFRFNVAAVSFAGLPFIPSATTNFSEALALNDSASLIVGRARNASAQNVATAWTQVSGSTYAANELPLFGTATSSTALSVSGDGTSIGGAVGTDAAVWNASTFEARPLVDVIRGVGLEIPTECVLSNVTDLDFLGQKVVGEATCDLGAGSFKRVYELDVPFSVPEPGLAISLGIAVAYVVVLRGSAGSQGARPSRARLRQS
jgi:uncharacterized membrane protein